MSYPPLPHGPNSGAVKELLEALSMLSVPELDAAATAANEFIRPRVTDALRTERAENMRRIAYAMEQQRYGMGFLSEAHRQQATRMSAQERERVLVDEPGHYEHAWSILEAEITAPVMATLKTRDGEDVGGAAYNNAMSRIIDAAKARSLKPGGIDQKTTEWLRPGAYAAERAGRVLVVQDLIPAAQFEPFAAPMRACGIDLLALVGEGR
ncbi:hypothetical protein ARHIZOSPH14_27260 [Agromyces rhizosphaerae]|uniref:DUF222 domain-containing protein n=1 Tax=Agromyces rhizosphaerae TaxID=88374 RepID=A0A9W6FPX3_9MICO|nr:hypothetical protein [Agromyces rhizosphaerae]GLI28484.1 hypothetical protein ARHIZOSPH14_27260 [Agromyces rhizosphaerae]